MANSVTSNRSSPLPRFPEPKNSSIDGDKWMRDWLRESSSPLSSSENSLRDRRVVEANEDGWVERAYNNAQAIPDRIIRQKVSFTFQEIWQRPHLPLGPGQYPSHVRDLIEARRSMKDPETEAVFDCLYPESAFLLTEKYHKSFAQFIKNERNKVAQGRSFYTTEKVGSGFQFCITELVES